MTFMFFFVGSLVLLDFDVGNDVGVMIGRVTHSLVGLTVGLPVRFCDIIGFPVGTLVNRRFDFMVGWLVTC